MQAPLAVAVEVRALDVGDRNLRAFRTSSGISEKEISVELALPFEPGRPVAVELFLPDDPLPVRAVGLVAGPPEEPRAVTFTRIDPDARVRVARYVEERLSQWPSP